MAIPSAIVAITSANKEIKTITVAHLLVQLISKVALPTATYTSGNNFCQYKHRLKHQPDGNNITIRHNKTTWQ